MFFCYKMEYNLSREQAAEKLWISTRTLDRRIRKWELSHQKKANKVYLSEEEVNNFWTKKQVSNVILEWNTSISKQTKQVEQPKINTDEIVKKVWSHMDESINKFLNVLIEKDKQIEDKNKIIMSLQQKTLSLESKLQNTVALPLYQEEKQEILVEKENLKIEKQIIDEKFKKEKIINIALIWIIIILIIVMILIIK